MTHFSYILIIFSAVVYGDNEILNDVRATGDVHDRCQDVFLQFVEFLCTILTSEEIESKIPKISQLCNELNMIPEDAFLIVRSFIDYSESAPVDARAVASGTSVEIEEGEEGEIGEISKSEQTIEKKILKENSLVDVMKEIVPTKSLSPVFYSAFWSNSLGDIHLPQLQYDSAIDSLSREVNTLSDQRDVCF